MKESVLLRYCLAKMQGEEVVASMGDKKIVRIVTQAILIFLKKLIKKS